MKTTLSGFAFPFRILPRRAAPGGVLPGGVQWAHGFEKVEANIRHLLSTRLGERVMLRTYGGGVHHRLQEPNNSTLRALVKHEIELALRTYLPEARLTGPIRLSFQEAELRVSVEYAADPRDTLRRLELLLP